MIGVIEIYSILIVVVCLAVEDGGVVTIIHLDTLVVIVIGIAVVEMIVVGPVHVQTVIIIITSRVRDPVIITSIDVDPIVRVLAARSIQNEVLPTTV